MFGIVYSQNTGRIRWYSDGGFTSDQIDQLFKIRPGESIIKVDDAVFNNHHILQDFINKNTGVVPDNDRYAVVDDLGKVVKVIYADPLCGDKVEGHELTCHKDAEIGWTKDINGQLKEPPKPVIDPGAVRG